MAGVNWRSHGTIEADSLPELCCAVPSRTAAYGNILSSLSGLFICLGLLSLCHSYPLFLSLSLALFLSFNLCLYLARSPSPCLSCSPSQTLCVSRSLSLTLYLSFSHPLSLSLTLCLFLSPSVSLSLTLVLCLTLSHSHPLSLFLSLSLSFSHPLSLSYPLSIFSYVLIYHHLEGNFWALFMLGTWTNNGRRTGQGRNAFRARQPNGCLAHMLTHMEEDHNITHEKHYLFRFYYPLT